MATAAAAARHLARVPLFAGLSRPELQRIAALTTERRAAAGDVLTREGDPGTELFLVATGEAEVRRRNRRVAVLTAGDVFGELALLDRGRRSATVVAKTPMRLLVLSELDFTALLDEIPALPHKLLALLAARLRATTAQSFD
jgi:CRP/FNR family cyclic AMP-dependent transcriptional regulator